MSCRIIGLTGGIACGKSSVAKLFSQLGTPVIDTDTIAKAQTGPGKTGLARIAEVFGPSALDAEGQLNRTWLRERIFSKARERNELEAILHPLILKEVQAHVKQQAAKPYCIVDIPLLLQAPAFLGIVNEILVVDCTPQTQIRRLAQRNGMDQQQARQIIASQTARSERLARADIILDNSCELDALFRKVSILHHHYLHQSAKTG